MRLHGTRVTLRPLAEEDLPTLVEQLAHPEVRAWWGDYDVARLRRDYLSEEGDAGFVIEDAGGAVAGMIGYWEETEPDHRHAGMDLFLAAHRHGEGLGTDALVTLGRHLVDERGHHRLVIDPSAANQKAIRAYEKAGFRPVGICRRAERSPDGEWRDSLLMDALAGELGG